MSILQVEQNNKKVFNWVFFWSPNPHLLPVRNNLLSMHSLPASDNTPTFAFLMRFIIPPHITLSATYFTFRRAPGLLLNFLNPAVNGKESAVCLRSNWGAAAGKMDDAD